MVATTAVLTENGVSMVEADLDDGRVVVDEDALDAALGWSLRPEGLCRADICVPVRDRSTVEAAGGIDLAAVADLLGSAVTVASDEAVVAIGVPRVRRGEALVDRRAADFELPDLEGRAHRLSSWDGWRRLLVAFASW